MKPLNFLKNIVNLNLYRHFFFELTSLVFFNLIKARLTLIACSSSVAGSAHTHSSTSQTVAQCACSTVQTWIQAWITRGDYISAVGALPAGRTRASHWEWAETTGASGSVFTRVFGCGTSAVQSSAVGTVETVRAHARNWCCA